MITAGGSLGTGDCTCRGKAASSPDCRCGMTMKITRSTGRISISGTTFASAIMPRLPPREPVPIAHLACRVEPCEEDSHIPRTSEILLPCFELCGDQANTVDTRAVHDVNGARHFHEEHVVIALDEGNLLGAILEDLFNAWTKTIPGGVFVVDFELAVLLDLDNNGFVLQLLVLLFIRRRLRDQGIESFWSQRSDNHENNNQHQQNVD